MPLGAAPARTAPGAPGVSPLGRREALDLATTLARLDDLLGHEVLVEFRLGGCGGQVRLTTRGVLLGPPVARLGVVWALGRHEAPADAVTLDSGGWLTVPETGFLRGEWWPGGDGFMFSTPPRLTIAFADSIVHVTVLDGPNATRGGGWPDDVDHGAAA